MHGVHVASTGFSSGQVSGSASAGQFSINSGVSCQAAGPSGQFGRQGGNLGAMAANVGFSGGQLPSFGGAGQGQAARPSGIFGRQGGVVKKVYVPSNRGTGHFVVHGSDGGKVARTGGVLFSGSLRRPAMAVGDSGTA